jgi:hypothetical protein
MRHVVWQADLYGWLLRLYPREYRTLFGAEMLAVLTESARERRCQGQPASVSFLLTELLGLVEGAAVEWRAKWTSRDYLAASQVSQTGRAALPAEVREAERHLEVTLQQMVEAIAHHQFQQARSLSAAERDARENLRVLREQYNLQDASTG